MIPINPFYVLLLLEILLIQAGLLIFLFLRGKKGSSPPEEQSLSPLTTGDPIAVLDVSNHEAPADLPKDEETAEPKTVNPVSNEDFTFLTDEATEEKTAAEDAEKNASAVEVKELQQTVAEKAEVIVELKHKLEEMEKKFESVENEYQILFDQSQKQEQALKAYEKGKGDIDQLFS
jgi:hypothetical protein